MRIFSWIRAVWSNPGHWFNRMCLHPAFATVLTALIIIIGVFGSIWTKEIREAFPFTFSPRWKNSLKADFVWSSGTMVAFMFFFRQRAVDRAQENAQGEIVARAEELAQLIRTLPPTNFLTVFGNMYGMATDTAYRVLALLNPSWIVRRQSRASVICCDTLRSLHRSLMGIIRISATQRI